MDYGVIMAGGAGTRLWPLSRGNKPKQLLPAVRGKSLLQLSYERLRGLLPAGLAPAQAALRWIIQQPGVTTVIPGARNPEQARQNAAAAGLPPLTAGHLRGIEDIYDRRIRAQVHDRW